MCTYMFCGGVLCTAVLSTMTSSNVNIFRFTGLFVWRIHRSPRNSLHKAQWRGPLMFSLICALNKRLSKQSWGWWFETPSRPLWRHCNRWIWRYSYQTNYACESWQVGNPSISMLLVGLSFNDERAFWYIMAWKRFPHYWPFVGGIPEPAVDTKGQ